MVTSQQRPQSVAFLDSVLSDVAIYMINAKPQREFDLCLIVTLIFILHFHFTFSILKLSFGILYTVSVYSGSLSYYGSHKSVQDTSLRFHFQSEFLSFYPYLVIRKVVM
jgi:hypothetical protein